MMTRIHILTAVLAFLLVSHSPAKIVFDSELVEIDVKPGEDVVTAVFPFKVEEEDETIVKVDVHCVCLGVRVEPLNPDRSAKLDWKVGEEGEIKIRFDTSKFMGTVEKGAALVLADREKPVDLTVRVKVPELIKVEPTTLKWARGGEGGEKVARITINHDKPIKIVQDVGRNKQAFPYELVTIREGWEYEVRMKPANTNESGMGMVLLTTDSEHPRFKRTAVYGVVRPELKSRPGGTR